MAKRGRPRKAKKEKVVIAPQKGSQELAMSSKADVIIYGGAAGCLDSETEFLTPYGWKKISDYEEGDKVLQYDTETRTASFTLPLEYIKKPSDGFYYIKTPRGFDQMLSKEHKVITEGKTGKIKNQSAEEFVKRHNNSSLGCKDLFLTTYNFKGKPLGVSEEELRFQVALKADGHLITKSTGRWRVNLKKARKVERFIKLLEENDISYNKRDMGDGFYHFEFNYLKGSFDKTCSDWWFCSTEDAEIIVDELKYWDSYYQPQGNRLPSFYTTIKEDADVVQHIFNVCGYRASIIEDDRVGRAQGEYIRKSVCYQVTPTTQTKINLARKPGNKIIIDLVEGSAYKYCFTVPTGAFVARRGGNVFITGNSGKSHLLLMHPLQHIHDPDFNGIYFRQVTTQLVGAGGLWPESKKMYSAFKTRERTKPQLQHTFPAGSTLTFSHMQHENDKNSHQGLQYSCVMFDELTHFSETQFIYLLSRLRSDAESDSYCMASCNPDPDSWVLKWVEWWLDEEGYPDPEKRGKLRYYIIIDDEPVFADTKEELIEEYPDSCKVWNPNTREFITIEPKSLIFIGGTIFDNPILIERNPKYLAELKSLPKVERARLLDGCWYARPEGSNYFQRNWLHKADELPRGVKTVRAWDKASSEPSDVNRYPDFTASIKISKDKDGFYYISGDYCDEAKDDKSEVWGRFRKRPGDRDRIILTQAEYDGDNTTVILPKDPGSAGQSEYQESAKKLIEEGFVVKADPMPSNKSKLKRFEPFSSAAQNGLVYIIENSFPNKATLNAFYTELEAFDGERSTANRKDDYPDCTASGFNYLAKTKVLPDFSLGKHTGTGSQTLAKTIMDSTIPNIKR